MFFISAKNQVGINDLIKEIFTLNSNETENIKYQTEIIKPKIYKRSVDMVVKKESDNSFRIIDREIIRLTKGSNMANWDTRVQLFSIITKRKITNMLIGLGIKTGDTLLIDDLEFEWE